MAEVSVRVRPWTNKITEHTVGRNVRVLSDTSNPKGTSNVTWSKGEYRTREQAEEMIAELQEAVKVMERVAREAVGQGRVG